MYDVADFYCFKMYHPNPKENEPYTVGTLEKLKMQLFFTSRTKFQITQGLISFQMVIWEKSPELFLLHIKDDENRYIV